MATDDDKTRFGSSLPQLAPSAAVDAPDPTHRKGGARTAPNALGSGFHLLEFELERVIGEGGFSIVYLAIDRQLVRRIAIKEYMPSALALRTRDLTIVPKSERLRETFEAGLHSFVNEARLLARFDHPSLVKVYRFWEERGTAYMVMPYYQGITLSHWRRHHGAADEAWLRRLLHALLDALAQLHAQDCYHRDIAPDNILLLPGDHPVLLDLGAARRIIGDMTHALTVILKPGFAPIEQYAEDASMKQGAWTDLYALAAVLYFVIAGRAPPPAVARMVKDEMRPALEVGAGRYSGQLLATIDAALAVLPADRPRNIEAFRALLNRETAQFGPPAAKLRPASIHPTAIPRVNIGAPTTPPTQPRTTAQPVPPTAIRRTASSILDETWSALTRKPAWALVAAALALIMVAAAWLWTRGAAPPATKGTQSEAGAATQPAPSSHEALRQLPQAERDATKK